MNLEKYFYLSQIAWVKDDSPLKIVVKSRQSGLSYCNDLRLVLLVSAKDARLDAFISSRDQFQSNLTLEDCVRWAKVLHLGASNLGEILLDRESNSSAYALQFANGRRIYCLSSNPNALAGKRGHVTLDEFALHQDQRLLYSIAKPVTMWGGEFSIISTPRGSSNLFWQIVTAARLARLSKSSSSSASASASSSSSSSLSASGREGVGEVSSINDSTVQRFNDSTHHDPTIDDLTIQPFNHVTAQPTLSHQIQFGSRWSLHEVPIQKAVAEGIVERINKKTGRNESREDFLKRLEAECINQEQWQQEYCCIPADENAAFLSYEMLDACTDPSIKLMTLEQLLAFFTSPDTRHLSLFLGLDVARFRHLCVIDVGEKIGSIVYDRLRIELHDKTFTEIEAQLYPLLRLPQLKRACIDRSGMGGQLAEQAREAFGWKVEPINFTQPRKEELAFALRRDFEDRALRIVNDDKLRADLRALQKEVSPNGKLSFIGDVENSHCDRTWAKALRQHAARYRPSGGAILI